jgi:hypothetical protein
VSASQLFPHSKIVIPAKAGTQGFAFGFSGFPLARE